MGKTVLGLRTALTALLMAPLLACAAGLGKLTVLSALGQPLNVEIEVVSVQSGEDDSLAARLGSPEAFRQAGIEMSPALVGAQFRVEHRADKAIVHMTTSQPVNEPFLDLLVELDWSTGRLVREYTFLLDPPEYRPPQPMAAESTAPPAAHPMPAPISRPAPRMESRPMAAAPAPAGTRAVKKGDTLGGIARMTKPDGVTLNQMLIALFRANREAFIHDNINLVRAGRILTIPDRDAIAAIDPAEANKLVRTHAAEFAEYKRKLAAAVAAAPATAPAKTGEVAGRIGAKAETPAPEGPKDQLKLSKAEPGKPGSPASKAAREDDRAARDRELAETRSRVTDLEKNVSDLNKLLEMKNQQLAELEKKAGGATAAAAPTAQGTKTQAEPKPAAPQPTEAKAPEAKAPEAKAPEAPKPAAPAPKPAPKAEPKKAPTKPAAKKPAPAKPAAEPDMLGEVIAFVSDPISGGGLAVVVVLLIGYAAWAWRRKKASQATTFQDSVLGAASGGSSVFGAAGQAAAGPATPQPGAAAAESSEASVSGPSVGAAEADEVDPIAEADVYMAYGRDAQAEEILKEALGKDANRVAVHAKLLEIYANRRDAKSFEQTALKVKSLTGGAGPEWDKAAALGHSIDPANGLYGAGGDVAAAAAPAAAPAAAAPTLDFDIGGGDAAAGGGAKADAGLDFDLGGGAAEPKSDFAPGGTLKLDAGEVKAASGGGLDLDLGGAAGEDDGEKTILMPRKAPAVPAAPAAAAPSGDPDATVAMDFDLNLDLGGGAKAEPPKPPAADAPLDLGGLSLDLGTPGSGEAPSGGGDAKWQEVATKLDLAKAYQEMGDKDGARELLNEVVKEGDAAQQSQAQQMLSGLG